MLLDVDFFNDTATTEIYTLSLHDALPISVTLDHRAAAGAVHAEPGREAGVGGGGGHDRADRPVGELDGRADDVLDLEDRKSTRLNSSHANISYAVFCLKKQ